MKKNLLLVLSLFVCQTLWGQIPPKEKSNPVIHMLSIVDSTIERYGKFECALEIAADYENPYDYDEVAVSAIFTSPGGLQKSLDGFFMQDYDLNPANGALSPVGQGVFKVRFSPDEVGEWTFRVKLSDQNGSTTFEEQSFECTPVSSPRNNGFVRVGQTNYLEFDNGKQLILVGENMAWENNNAYIDYKEWLTNLSEADGNFIRLWHAHWGLGVEWKAGWDNFEGLRRYKQSNCFYQDWLYDFCAEKGIYVMLALQHHGPVSSNVNPNWNDSPYNAANGGPCQNTWHFFTNEEAIAHTKNRYRYILARWGYSRSIQSWELFNEVDWTDNFSEHQTEVQDWHTEMAGYLKTTDPYRHLVTTSYAHSDQDPVVWSNPDMDFTQTHFYLNTSNIERALAGGVRAYIEEFEKPTLSGEFGLGGYPELSDTDADGVHFHNGMWGALFGGGMGTAMSWWWDSYVQPRNLYYHFAPIAAVANQIPFLAENMSPTLSYVRGSPGDLVLTPNLGWGVRGDEMITINENGTTTPANPGLGQFLYGSQWNTQHRSPPSFQVVYPVEGEFSLRTNSEAGESPKISIYLNGALVLNENAVPNKTYAIPVPAGSNLIKVDNLGTDWATIASYTFTGVGSKIDSYTLAAENKKVAAGWVLNQEYNHQFIQENGAPNSILGGELIVEDFLDGDYFVRWYDCLTGELVSAAPVSALNSQLFLPIPELYWDLAYRVDDQEIEVTATQSAPQYAFKLYPNPARPGAPVTIETESENLIEKIVLLDASGKPLSFFKADRQNQVDFSLPSRLPAGFYWLKIENAKGGIQTKPLAVGRF